MTADPRVSVVIPVKDRRELLASCLHALDAQTVDDVEVIVVDDGSTDGSDGLAERSTVRGRPVRLVRNPGTGAVDARVAGVDAALGEYLAFTDSDCEPDPGWLEAGLAALDAGAPLVNGTTVPARPMKPLERSMASGTEGLFPTCNVFYRRDAFHAVGGFDRGVAERLGFRRWSRAAGLGFGEDTVLAWRVQDQIGPAVHVEDAVVRHHVFPPDLGETFSRTLMAGAFPAFVREVPSLGRTLIRHRVLLGGPDRLPVYLAALATLVGRRRVAVVATGWWVGRRAAGLRSMAGSTTEKAAALPVLLALDATMAAVLVAGSARARRLVL